MRAAVSEADWFQACAGPSSPEPHSMSDTFLGTYGLAGSSMSATAGTTSSQCAGKTCGMCGLTKPTPSHIGLPEAFASAMKLEGGGLSGQEFISVAGAWCEEPTEGRRRAFRCLETCGRCT